MPGDGEPIFVAEAETIAAAALAERKKNIRILKKALQCYNILLKYHRIHF